jgi:hypothetical protein
LIANPRRLVYVVRVSKHVYSLYLNKKKNILTDK